jgi:nucleotide-binding universal stress UspA family protein
MATRFLLGVDDSQDTFEALEKVGSLFLKTEAHFHLFQAVTESNLPAPPPTSTETADWQGVQKRQAQQILDKAVSSLLQMGYKRARISTETRLQSANAAQEILNAGKRQEIMAIVFARKQPSGVKGLLRDATTSNIYRYAEVKPLWAIGNLPLQPLNILAAVDESDYADSIAVHLARTLGPLPQVRVTFLNIMPAKPPAYWDDGHILDKAERGERRGVVKKWQWSYEEMMGGIFAKARGVLTKAGVAEERISTKMQTRRSGTARDVLAELDRGGYNIVALGKRGSGSSQVALGSRAAKILRSVRDCTIILVS